MHLSQSSIRTLRLHQQSSVTKLWIRSKMMSYGIPSLLRWCSFSMIVKRVRDTPIPWIWVTWQTTFQNDLQTCCLWTSKPLILSVGYTTRMSHCYWLPDKSAVQNLSSHVRLTCDMKMDDDYCYVICLLAHQSFRKRYRYSSGHVLTPPSTTMTNETKHV